MTRITEQMAKALVGDEGLALARSGEAVLVEPTGVKLVRAYDGIWYTYALFGYAHDNSDVRRTIDMVWHLAD